MAKKNNMLIFGIIGVVIIAIIIGVVLFIPKDDKSINNTNNFPVPNNNSNIVNVQPVIPITKNPHPTYIGNLMSQLEGDKLWLAFSFYDDTQENFMTTEGSARIRIVSDDSTVVYENIHHISNDDFGIITIKLTQQQIQVANIYINLSDINKSSTEYGAINLEFTIDGGKTFGEISETTWNLPVYSAQELSQITDIEFNKNAIELNSKKDTDNFSVEINKIGLVNMFDYSTLTKYIRIDITVENIGDKKKYFSPNPVILGKNNNQYDKIYISEDTYTDVFDSGEIYPGVIKKGAMFFKVTEDDSLDLKTLIMETGWDSELKFDLSDVELK